MSPSKHLSHLSPRALAAVVFVMIFGGSLVVMSYLYVQAEGQRKEALHGHVLDLAVAAAAMVDIELHESLVRPEQLGAKEYRTVLAPLVKFQHRHPNIQYLWTTRVPEQGPQLFVLETSTDEDIRTEQLALGRSQDLLAFLEPDPVTAAGAKSIPVLRTGSAWVDREVYADSHGSYIEARAPLVNTEERFVGYVGVDYALDIYLQKINEVRMAGLVSLLLALGLSVVLARTAYMVSQRSRDSLRMAREQRDFARKASEAKSELLAIASHDLKNPLSAIVGMSELLLNLKRAVPDQNVVKDDVEVLETIHASSKHMSEIVRGILSNEGLEYGGLAFKPEELDLAEIVRATLKFNASAAERKKIEVVTEIPETLMVGFDPKLIREAFDNYVSNAIKYSPSGSRVAVSLGLVPGANEVEFSVQDAGPGLSREDQAKLFRKFQKLTPRPTGGESSTGLGLSIVKTIAELHHGSVGCESEPGHGSRFWLRLPVGRPAPGSA
ncbi:MAG: HAMP domain-containing histidine kinase [Cephaloticoccus sp.]|nr:HAMP domain-containing histidine kinase [Cephaloticoccus sp.]MCF7759489.1 HAMP domain-containing histidine kinase [Cephaloticoccus sp.]